MDDPSIRLRGRGGEGYQNAVEEMRSHDRERGGEASGVNCRAVSPRSINAALIANVRVRMNKIVDQYERDEYGKLKLEKEMKVTADVSALIMRVSSLAHCSNFSSA